MRKLLLLILLLTNISIISAQPDPNGLPDPIQLTWNSDGTRLAVGTSDGIFIYDTADWQQPPTQLFAESVIFSLAFSPDNPDLIAVSSRALGSCGAETDAFTSGVFVYDLSVDEVSTVIRDFSNACTADLVTQLQFGADGTILFTNSGGQFASYTLPNGSAALNIAPYDFGQFPAFDQIAISGDGSQIALAQTTGNGQGYLFRADFSDGGLVGFEDGRITQVVTALALNSNGNQIIIGDAIGSLRRYTRLEGATSYAEYQSVIRENRSNTSNRINAIDLGTSGVIVTAESDPHAVVRVFDPEMLVEIRNYFAGPSTSAAVDLEFNPYGSLLAVIVDDVVHILDPRDYKLVTELGVPEN